jgi:hypothetical protein
MSDVVLLSKAPIDLNSDIGRAFVVDATRAGEGLITDAELQEKYELSPTDWQNITKDRRLGRAIRDERDRRVRNGTAARESAARHFVKAPTILAGIMESEASSAKHVIEAAKEIRQVATGGSDGSPASQGEKFSITINLGADVERYEFDVTPNKAKQLEPDHPDDKPDGNWG